MMTVKRAKVRLRLDRGTARLKDLNVGNVVCDVIDISEGGCACRLVFSKIDRGSIDGWKTILVNGRNLTLDLSESVNIPGFVIPECEIRWVQAHGVTELTFGVSFSGLDAQQKDVLENAIMSLASDKLRTTKVSQPTVLSSVETRQPISEAASFKQTIQLPVAERLRQTRRKFESYIDPSATTSRPVPSSQLKTHDQSHDPRWSSLDSIPSRPKEKGGLWNETQAQDRQQRHSAAFPIAYDFIDDLGNKLSEVAEGRVRDFNEGGFLIEGTGPAFCSAMDLLNRGVGMLATLQVGVNQLAAKLQIVSVAQSPNEGLWHYGVRITDMLDVDRAMLRELYIRAALTIITRKQNKPW